MSKPVVPSICTKINTRRTLSAAHACPLSAKASENLYYIPASRSAAPIVGDNFSIPATPFYLYPFVAATSKLSAISFLQH
jgi:hypothetical protein